MHTTTTKPSADPPPPPPASSRWFTPAHGKTSVGGTKWNITRWFVFFFSFLCNFRSRQFCLRRWKESHFFFISHMISVSIVRGQEESYVWKCTPLWSGKLTPLTNRLQCIKHINDSIWDEEVITIRIHVDSKTEKSSKSSQFRGYGFPYFA